MSSSDDETLTREFGKLRAEDAARVPPFASMSRARVRPLPAWWFALPPVSACVAAATIIWALHARVSEPARAALHPPVVQVIDPEPLAFLEAPVLAPPASLDESVVAR